MTYLIFNDRIFNILKNYSTKGDAVMKKIFIDGAAGTTGLNIRERLKKRNDVEIIEIDENKRKDVSEKKRLMNMSDVVFLCLPDSAAVESVGLIENETTCIIDTSTAHRCSDDWTYGFPELTGLDTIRNSKRIANPGCHATGFICSVSPLVKLGIIDPGEKLACFSLTGYSGGGKKMIAQYESDEKTSFMSSPGIYSLSQEHKHLPEMRKMCSLEHKPIFCPIVDDYLKGMATTVALDSNENRTADSVRQALSEFYKDSKLISVRSKDETPSTIYANEKAGLDSLEIIVCGNDERITITALFDNLGKGACGSAIENMNIVLGLDETTGLNI